MKKEWKKPELEVLNLSMTAMGPNNGGVDLVVYDPSDGEEGYLHS